MKRTILLSTMAVWLLAALALAPGQTEGPERVLPRPRPPDDAIAAFASHLEVGRPRHHRNLTLYPIFAKGATVPGVDLTLDEAIDKGLLEIRELKSAEVNRVRVYSKAKRPIFVMGGEMVGGAKQDRIVGDDVVIPPRAKIVIPVFCVEHGRWVAKSETFQSTAALAGRGVRMARARAGQSEVWAAVASEQERLAAPSPTGSLQSVQQNKAVREKARPYTLALSDLPTAMPKAQGVVAAVGGEIIAADLFASRSLFRKLWPKLLQSYVTDALDREGRGRRLDAVAVRKWLRRIARADRIEKGTPGDGRLYELRGGSMIGSALVSKGAVVHMELFPGVTIAATDFNRLEFRRERLQQRD